MEKLKNKTAVITGATSGMGKAIAVLFATEGAKVVVNGRNEDNGEKVVNDIREAGGEAVFVQSDISSTEGNELLMQKTMEAFGAPDIVVLNAGYLGLGRLTEVSPEKWHKTIDTNLNSIYYFLRLAIPEMQKKGTGTVIVNGSIAAFKSFPGHPAYNAAKGALVPLVKQIALDYGPEIRINLICPGPIDTPLIWNSAKAFPEPEKAVAEAATNTVLGRLGKPEEIAKAALFLASDDSSFITGAVITIDGGVTVK